MIGSGAAARSAQPFVDLQAAGGGGAADQHEEDLPARLEARQVVEEVDEPLTLLGALPELGRAGGRTG